MMDKHAREHLMSASKHIMEDHNKAIEKLDNVLSANKMTPEEGQLALAIIMSHATVKMRHLEFLLNAGAGDD